MIENDRTATEQTDIVILHNTHNIFPFEFVENKNLEVRATR